MNVVARSTLMRAHNHSDAQCSSKARLSSAKFMTSSQIGFLDALNMPWVWHDGLRASTCVQACFCQGSMYVYMQMGYWSSSVRLRRASRQSSRCACVCQLPLLRLIDIGFNVSEVHVMNLRKLAQARPTMPCIPLVYGVNLQVETVHETNVWRLDSVLPQRPVPFVRLHEPRVCHQYFTLVLVFSFSSSPSLCPF